MWRCEKGSSRGAPPLCLKMTRDQASWHREAYMAELVGDHPRVVTVHETFPLIDNKKMTYVVVMELAEHGTLADVIERDGPWDERRAVSEITKLLGAVDRLHACGALHRDITPYNVFVCGDKRVLKLGDFGITTHGPRKGVAANAFAPWFVDTAIREEQRVRWDTREDLWQVAQVLGVLLTGKVEPLRLADVRRVPCSAATRAVIARATGERSSRFDNAKAMCEALKGAAAPPKTARPRSLKGRYIVFTGQLRIPRKEAIQLAEAAGAVVDRSVTARTDMVVVGESKLWAAGDAGGRKLLAAAAKREGGRKIDPIREDWFMRLVGGGRT